MDYSVATTHKNDSISVLCSRPADCLNEGLDLNVQSKEFLIERVLVLERQLKIRNRDCSRLLQERHDLQRGDRPRTTEKTDERVRELEKEICELRRKNRELTNALRRADEYNTSSLQNSRPTSPGRLGSRVTIINTEMGPQVVYDSGVNLDPDVSYGGSPHSSPGRYNTGAASAHYPRGAAEDEARLQAKLRSM